ncbi:MAG: hypothetical protein ABI042_13980 [Verrucomicrobiota bacterium]
MTEENYRKYQLMLLAVLVAGVFLLGWSIRQLAENGRFVQYDKQTDYVVYGNAMERGNTQVIDTRTGQLKKGGVGALCFAAGGKGFAVAFEEEKS